MAESIWKQLQDAGAEYVEVNMIRHQYDFHRKQPGGFYFSIYGESAVAHVQIECVNTDAGLARLLKEIKAASELDLLDPIFRMITVE